MAKPHGGRAAAGAATAAAVLRDGLVVASHGRHCLVETPEGQRLICHPRGKKSQALVGDRVQWQASEDEGTIEKVLPRKNLFYRQDEIRTKSFAANLDCVLVLVAAEPEFSETQLSRALIAAAAAGITPVIALNKSDLVVPFERAWGRLAPYRRMHYGVLPLSLKASGEVDRAALVGLIAGKVTLVLGPSGAGKSTLINLLVPGATVLTGEISQALNSGKHHHHQHHLVLGRSGGAHHRADRLAGFPGIRPVPHRADAAGAADARHRRARERLQSSTTAPTCTSPAAASSRRSRRRSVPGRSAPRATASTASCSPS